MQALDLRLVKLSIEVNGVTKTYQDLMITANGMKYANALQNECEVTIANLDRATQDYILTQTSPYTFNRTPKTVTIEAGRQSYGTTVIYVGNIVLSTLSQPPDQIITLKCLTGNFLKGSIISRNQSGLVPISVLSTAIAQDLNTSLNFQAPDKNIANYSFNGAALKQVDVLNGMGGINAFIDDNTLIVKGAGAPIRINGSERILSSSTGLIGIPEFTQQGIKVKFFIDNKTRLGSSLRIQSKEYPAANGVYIIYKLGFQIANRDTPFYYIAECARIQ